jgi:GxxExxY protein
MNADRIDSLECSHLTKEIIGAFYEVYNELGAGFLESVYANAMFIALRQRGLKVERERPISVRFRGNVVGDFRADLLVNDQVICELKAASVLDAAFVAQTLNYLRASDIEVGLVLNFGPKPDFKRLVFKNSRKKTANPR